MERSRIGEVVEFLSLMVLWWGGCREGFFSFFSVRVCAYVCFFLFFYWCVLYFYEGMTGKPEWVVVVSLFSCLFCLVGRTEGSCWACAQNVLRFLFSSASRMTK